jgi:hypothetical protein
MTSVELLGAYIGQFMVRGCWPGAWLLSVLWRTHDPGEAGTGSSKMGSIVTTELLTLDDRGGRS